MTGELVARARLFYLKTSAQKTRLVLDLIRGLPVGEAGSVLRQTKKSVAEDVDRLLDSAVANARQKKQHVDVDRLYIHTVHADGGPSIKRIRAAPMGRAFRILKRTCHVTIGLGEKAQPEPQVRKEAAPERKTTATRQPAAKTAGKSPRGARTTKAAIRKKRTVKTKGRR